VACTDSNIVTVGETEQDIEWIQCTRPDRGKWRCLPDDVRVSDLPDDFVCENIISSHFDSGRMLLAHQGPKAR
jgi:hypothetical protein